MKTHVCAGCNGSGIFSDYFGGRRCEGCAGRGVFSYIGPLSPCPNCGATGHRPFMFQGERIVEGRCVEMFPHFVDTACEVCAGRGFRTWVFVRKVGHALLVVLLLPVIAWFKIFPTKPVLPRNPV